MRFNVRAVYDHSVGRRQDARLGLNARSVASQCLAVAFCVTLSVAYLATGTAAFSQTNRTHTLTPGQVQAIMNAAMAWQGNVIMPQVEKPKPGPMRALRAPDGNIQFCAFVYTGTRSLFGTPNRQFVFGTFPSATSNSVVAQRQYGDGPGNHDECRRKGIGVL